MKIFRVVLELAGRKASTAWGGVEQLMGLPEVAAFVGDEDMESGGQAEADRFDEWIGEGDVGEIEWGDFG